MGSWAPMSTAVANRRALAPLAIVTVAAFLFALLLILVRLQWAPLESVDHDAAAGLNRLVAGDAAVVGVIKAVTWLGSSGVLWTVTGTAAVGLAIRRRWRLAIYLLVAGAGVLTLDPVLKALVGRLRPVVAHPIAYGTGDSFPSGHALGSIVCYGAVLLVFLPAARGRWRTAFITVIVALVALIYAMLYRTRFGRSVRATMQDETAARLVGIDVNRVAALTFGIGVAVTAAGGMVFGATNAFNPNSGYDLISRLLAIIILGGLGSIGGALAASVFMLVVESLVTIWSPNWAVAVFYAALVVVLVVRPTGFFGRKEVRAQ